VQAAVGHESLRTKRNQILAAEFGPNILEGNRQIIRFIRKEGLPTGLIGKILQQFFPVRFELLVNFFIAFEGNPVGVGADGVNGDAGTLGHLQCFADGVIT
jgi:hypothetical protein